MCEMMVFRTEGGSRHKKTECLLPDVLTAQSSPDRAPGTHICLGFASWFLWTASEAMSSMGLDHCSGSTLSPHGNGCDGGHAEVWFLFPVFLPG